MELWNQFSRSLLETNHITIPIEKRFFINFIEDDTESFQKQKLLDEFVRKGFLEDDPRLQEIRKKIIFNVKNHTINYEEFKYCIENNISILQKIFKNEMIIPNFPVLVDKIGRIYETCLSFTSGSNAAYIPQLKNVDSSQFGVSICTIDGQRHNYGDSSTYFSVQSCCKPINYAIALENMGEEYVHKFVGREPSGQAFNELLLNKRGLPHNPLINSGAIMTTSLLYPEKDHSERFELLIKHWDRLSGGLHKIGFNNSVYLSEKKTADRNYALAYFMNEICETKPTGFPPGSNIKENLDLYFQSCSIEITTEILSIVASTFANGGINPFTGERIFTSQTVQKVLSMMLMCGMYDYSGEFAFKIGIPSKSGVAGAIMTVIPNVMGIATWSPKLDVIGNSVRGIEFCKCIGETFNFHIFDTLEKNTYNPLANPYATESTILFTQMCFAAKQGDLEHLKVLFNKEVDWNQSDYDKRTVLHIAVSEEHIEVVSYLLRVAKTNPHKQDRWSKSPYDIAMESDNQQLQELFVSFNQ